MTCQDDLDCPPRRRIRPEVSSNDLPPGRSHDVAPWAEFISQRIPKGGTYCEVGVFLGQSLARMGKLRPDITLIAIDPWIAEPGAGWEGLGIFQETVAQHGGDLFLAFLKEMLAKAPDVLRRTQVIRGTANTVSIYHSFDVLFIDGAHDHTSVVQDLDAFAALVKPGGILSGHDYHPDFPGVVRAVDDFENRKPKLGTPDGQSPTVWWFDDCR